MNICKFCGNKFSHEEQNSETEIHNITCPVCGTYKMSDIVFRTEISAEEISQGDKILFSGYLRNSSTRKNPILIKRDTIKNIPEIVAPYRSLSVVDKINNVILFLGKNSKFLGDEIQLSSGRDFSQFFCQNDEEILRILDHLRERGLASLLSFPAGPTHLKLLVDGWAKYEELKQINIDSKKVFVAMKFGVKELDGIYHNAIKPACEECGFDPIRVDIVEHIDKICDRIIGEIKQSRFVIADFTRQNQGVYYEAGFAEGLGLPVIKTCKKPETENLHFDIRQYNHIEWENAEELKARLINRIRATIL